MAGEMLLTVSRDEVEQAQKEMALKRDLDWQSDLVQARKKGEAKARLESARRMKADGFSAADTKIHRPVPGRR